MRDNYIRKIIAHKVYDGDTITNCSIDLGFNTWLHKQRIRIYGINAYEIRGGTAYTKSKAKKAKKLFQNLLAASNNECNVKTIEKDKKGKYGRWLAHVYFTVTPEIAEILKPYQFYPASTVNFGDLLISIKLAKPYMVGKVKKIKK